MKKFLERHLLIKYISDAFAKTLIVLVMLLGLMFAIFKLLGWYSRLETMLDLKYDSPWILVPLFAAAVLAMFSLLFGLILYLHKYKRSNAKSEFYKSLSFVLKDKQD